MVKFFAWLLSKARVQSRASLLRKNIMFVAEAICPISQAPLETANHIFLECQFARRFWATAGFQFPGDADVRLLHEYAAPTFTLPCLWNLWKHSNAVAFGAAALPPPPV
jgi:hypothetical protein